MVLALPFPPLDPVALELGPIVIRWYALAYLAGFIGGWRYALWLAARKDGAPTSADIDDFLTWAVIGTVLGGRLGFVAFYQPAYYLANPAEIFQLWQGGMAFHGGILGVTGAILLFAWRRKFNPLALGDLIAAAAPIGLFFGRIANFINNELWGRPSDAPWAVVFPIPESLQDRIPEVARHPSQLYEAALEGAALFVILYFLAIRTRILDRPGTLAGLFVAFYGLFRFLVEFVRAYPPDEILLFDIFTRGQQLSAPMMLIGLAMAVICWRRGRRPASDAS